MNQSPLDLSLNSSQFHSFFWRPCQRDLHPPISYFISILFAFSWQLPREEWRLVSLSKHSPGSDSQPSPEKGELLNCSTPSQSQWSALNCKAAAAAGYLPVSSLAFVKETQRRTWVAGWLQSKRVHTDIFTPLPRHGTNTYALVEKRRALISRAAWGWW